MLNEHLPLVNSKGERVLAWKVPQSPIAFSPLLPDPITGKSPPTPEPTSFKILVHPDNYEEFLIRATQPGLWELIEGYGGPTE